MLILAGLKVDTELSDPATIELIQKVLDELNTDEYGAINEDEAMFACRFNEFERKDRKSRTKGMEGGRQRARATKRVDEKYNIERA